VTMYSGKITINVIVNALWICPVCGLNIYQEIGRNSKYVYCYQCKHKYKVLKNKKISNIAIKN